MPKPTPDISGQRFGRLVVLSRAAVRIRQQICWHCLCDCGQTRIAPGADLRRGGITSCGCVHPSQTHNHYRTPGYNSYVAMIRRCTNPKDKDYPRYGAKNVKICSRWIDGDGLKSGIECFFEDMGARPTHQLSIDRFPNKSGNYEPSNCRWATAYEQALNRHNNYFDQNVDPKEVCRISGVKYGTFRERVSRGWTIEDALRPSDMRRKR